MPNFGADLAAGVRAYNQVVRDQMPVHMDPTGLGMRTHVAASQAARRLQGTQLETELLDPAALRLMGQFNSAALSDTTLNAASPLRFMDPETLTNLRDELMRRAGPAASASRTRAPRRSSAPRTCRAWPGGSSRSTAR